MTPERAPVQRHRYEPGATGLRGKLIPFPRAIPWVMHERAWSSYAIRHSSQSAERLAERGGFGVIELVMCLTPGIGYDGDPNLITDAMIAKVRDEAEGLDALRDERDYLRSEVEALRGEHCRANVAEGRGRCGACADCVHTEKARADSIAGELATLRAACEAWQRTPSCDDHAAPGVTWCGKCAADHAASEALDAALSLAEEAERG